MEKNRKLDPMDPKIFDIKRPSLDYDTDGRAHFQLGDEYQARRRYQEDESFAHNELQKLIKKKGY